MTSALRKFLLVSICSIGISALAACSGKDESTADILAQDSTLAREVMSANLDTTVLVASVDSTDLMADQVESTQAPATSTATASPEPTAQPAAGAISKATTRPRRIARSSASARSRGVYSAARGTSARTTAARDARSSGVSSRSSSRVLASSTTSRSAFAGTKLGGSAMIPVGSELSFASEERICTSTGNVVGRFSTRLAEDIVGPIGVVIPKGAIATGLVAAGGNGSADKAERAIHIQSLTFGGRTYSLSSEVTSAKLDKKRTRSKTAPAKLIAGAGVGAILGHVLGGNATSTVIGAAGGAAAGAVVANRTTGFDRCVPSGGLITARLTEPLRVALGE